MDNYIWTDYSNLACVLIIQMLFERKRMNNKKVLVYSITLFVAAFHANPLELQGGVFEDYALDFIAGFYPH